MIGRNSVKSKINYAVTEWWQREVEVRSRSVVAQSRNVKSKTKKATMNLLPIENKIYSIRGVQVMLDFDIAEMYGVETRRLNEAVKRNIERFPEEFMFQLTKLEWENLMSQIATSSWGGTRKLPYVFTEHGVTMLSSVLRSSTAVQASIVIVKAFVAMRQLVLNPPTDKIGRLETEMQELKQYIEEIFTDYNDINEDTRLQLEQINITLAEMQVKNRLHKPRRRIGFYTEEQRQNNEDVIN